MILVNATDLIKYREFDRKLNPLPEMVSFFNCKMPVSQLTENIKANGIQKPLELTIVDGKALLTEGNHRLSIALENGIEKVPLTLNYTVDSEWHELKKDKFVPYDSEFN